MKYTKFFAIPLIATVALCVVSCDKDDKKEPIPSGTISGNVTPAEAAVTVWAVLGADSTEGKPDDQGNFLITGLKPDAAWKIGYDATAAGYEDLIIENVTITDGETTQLEAVVIEPEEAPVE